MAESIDFHDLTEEDVRLVNQLVEFLRYRVGTRKEGPEEESVFTTWPLGVKGPLTREEIYDYV